MENLELIIFEIINNGGNAKSLVYEAIAASENGEFEKADKLLKEADEYLIKAHNIQTNLIKKEAEGKQHDITVIFVHAQDHLMNAIEVRTLSENIIKMNKRLFALENNK